MKTRIISAAAVVAVAFGASAREPVATASFEGNEIRLYAQPLAYGVSRAGTVLVPETPIGICLDGECRADAAPASVANRTLSGVVATPVYKKASVDLSGAEAVADFGDFAVRLAARADGVAYRFELKKAATVTGERADVTIPSDARCWLNRGGSPGCEETIPEAADASALEQEKGRRLVYLPFAYTTGGKTAAIVEADVLDYPIWNFGEIEKTAVGVRLHSTFEKYPTAERHMANDKGWKRVAVDKGGRWVVPTERGDYIAKAAAPRALPWRGFVLADSPSALCENDLVYALATPAAPGADFSWVKPGKVAWDWWNCFDNRLTDPANGGCNTKTYERFIDFAAKNGVEYVIFDEGWSETLNIWKDHECVDVPHLIKYANERGVGIILWMAWAQVHGDEEKVAEHFSKLGAKGFKVDFMDRGDAGVAAFLERFAAACAKNKMLVDYHGVYRPTGLHRRYPNVVNYEGVHGLEQSKWYQGDGHDKARNDVGVFYLRMTAGPMDFTPGAMLNHAIGGGYDGKKAGAFPGSIGTRCRQMAMMSLYEAPLQMLCDSPTNYEKNMESFKFMAAVPTVWAETVGLPGTPESVAAAARKAKDGSWYASAMTDDTARDYALDTSFLGCGEWKAEIFRDAADSDAEPTHYVHETRAVKAGETLEFRLAPGGAFTIHFTR